MFYTTGMLLLGLVLGFIAVAANPSPYFGALGLMAVSGVGCGILTMHGATFLSLILFLIYLGGMLVVFAYSSALATDKYPPGWGDRTVLIHMVFYMTTVFGLYLYFLQYCVEACVEPIKDMDTYTLIQRDGGALVLLYGFGGFFLVVGAGMLLLTLFVVLELTRGLSRVMLRAV